MVKRQLKHLLFDSEEENPPDQIKRFSEETGIESFDNSLNIVIGSQGSGKTTYAANEVLAIVATVGINQLVVVMRKQYDPKINSLSRVLEEHGTPTIILTWSPQLPEQLNSLLEAKRAYQNIIREAKAANIPESKIASRLEGDPTELLQILGLTNFTYEPLRTVIIFDDTGRNPLLRKEGMISNMIRIARELNIITFILTHAWNDLDISIRSNASLVILTPGLSRNRLVFIHNQTNTETDFSDFLDMYKTNPKRYLIIDNQTGEIRNSD
jgi:hypothetical protein